MFRLLGDVESFADRVLLFIVETYFYTLSNYYLRLFLKW